MLPAANGRRHERAVLFGWFTAGRRHDRRVAPGIIRLGAPLPVHSLTIDNAAANRSREIQVTAGGGWGSPSSPRARRCVPRAQFQLRVPQGRVEARERAASPSLRPRGVRPVGEPRQMNWLTLTRLHLKIRLCPNSCGPEMDVTWLLLVFCLHVVAAEGTASPRGDRPGLVRTPQEVDHPEPVACQCGPVARRGRGAVGGGGALSSEFASADAFGGGARVRWMGRCACRRAGSRASRTKRMRHSARAGRRDRIDGPSTSN